MSASPVQPLRLIPATITSGGSAGATTQKVLVDPNTGNHYCADCDYTHPNFASVRAHRRAHSKPSSPRKSSPSLTERVDTLLSIAQELREATLIDPSADKVDPEWKDRALKAERRLATLRRALGGDAA